MVAASFASTALLRSGADHDHRHEPHLLGDRGDGGKRDHRVNQVVDQTIDDAEARESAVVGSPGPLEDVVGARPRQ